MITKGSKYEAVEYLSKIILPTSDKLLISLVEGIRELEGKMLIFNRCSNEQKEFLKVSIVNYFHKCCENSIISLGEAIDFHSKYSKELGLGQGAVLFMLANNFSSEDARKNLSQIERLSNYELLDEELRVKLQLKVYELKMGDVKRGVTC